MLLDPDPAKRLYLVGAGISVDEPSGVAGVPDLLDIIFRKMQVRNGPGQDTYWRAATIAPAHNPFGALRFEAVIQALVEVAPEVRDLLPEMATTGAPNACHLFLASEIGRGATVVTTNFDRRIEEACERLGVGCEPFVLSGRRPCPSPQDRFVKLHGSFGGRAMPRATLLAIGRVGLGFRHFPKLRGWVEERARDCDLIVLGYSASDHFDVAPLIEQCARPRKVFWMDYDPGCPTPRFDRHGASQDPTIPPRTGWDFPGAVLGSLACHCDGVETWRVKANSTCAFIAVLEPNRSLEIDTNLKAPASRRANVKGLKARFSKMPVSAWQRREFAKMLLEEDPYGGYLGSDFEKGSLEDGAQRGTPLFEAAERDIAKYGLAKAKARLARRRDAPMTPNQRGHFTAKWFYFETQVEDDAAMFEAAKALVSAEVERGIYNRFRGDELLLMMLEDVFDGASLRRNVRVMRAVARHVRSMFRTTGHIGAGVQALLMDTRLRHRELLGGAARGERRARLLREGLEQSRAAVYFAIRTGREDIIEQAVWLYAFFLESTGGVIESLSVLENYVEWIAEDAHETRGVTLTNLALVAARIGDLAKARCFVERMLEISANHWPAQRVFHAVAEAQLTAKEGRKERALEWITTARSLIDTLSPGDPWRHREELGFLEAQLEAA